MYLNFVALKRSIISSVTQNQFFKLSCSDTFLVEYLGCMPFCCMILSSFLLLSSYGHIVSAIMKLSSPEAGKKTFSTCASPPHCGHHLLWHHLFFHVRPPAKHNFTMGKVMLSHSYCVVTPTLLKSLVYTPKKQR